MTEEGGSTRGSPTADETDRVTGATATIRTDRRRREALAVLLTFTAPMTLPTLADYVTELEYDIPAEEYPDERLRIYMSLYHDHIPDLEAAELVVYSQEDDVIDLGDRADEVEDDRAIRMYSKELLETPTDDR